MNPNSNEAPAMQLPPPVMEQTPPGGAPAEQAPAGTELARGPAAQGAAAPPANIPLPTQPALPATQQAAGAAAVQAAPALQTADDGDLIEKEWVNKAKQIVNSTREDPYKQSEELTVFKADYMKKRYGKTIKLNK